MEEGQSCTTVSRSASPARLDADLLSLLVVDLFLNDSVKETQRWGCYVK